MLSNRIRKLKPSPTLELDATVKRLAAEGHAVVNLGLGEPDFATPISIQRAAIAAIRDGFTHYTMTAGIPELRQAITQKLRRENGVTYRPEEIVVGVGTKQLLYHAFQVLCEAGDEVIIPTPTWSTYIEHVRLSGATPVLVPLASPFRVTAAAIAHKVTRRTKVLLLNSPANPTGAMIDEQELAAIAALAVKRNIFVISDEIYEHLVFGKKHHSIAAVSPKVKAHTLTISGFSKSYAMAGWRIGYAAGPRAIITAMAALQSQTTSNTSSIGQKAAVEALTGSQHSLRRMVREYDRRRSFVARELATVPELDLTIPDGAFYFFIGVKRLLSRRYPTSAAWCRALLERERVAVVPGEAFVAPGFVRLSFAAPLNTLQEGIKRLRRFIKTYG